MTLKFTSLGANFDQSLLDRSGPYVLKLYGELYHNHGVLIPNKNRISPMPSSVIERVNISSDFIDIFLKENNPKNSFLVLQRC